MATTALTVHSYTHIKNGGSFKKYSKFTPKIIHINPNFLLIQGNVYNDYRTVFYHLFHQCIKI